MEKETFKNPPMDCRPAPFWSWNGDLDPEETRWQVREMADKGMGGGFIHSRSGLRTEYLGDDWFENCAASIDEGKKIGFLSWLYDEDRWPSGSCGGRTAAAHPDYRCRALVMQQADESVLAEEPVSERPRPYEELLCLARFKVNRRPDGGREFLTAEADAKGPDIVAFHSALLVANGWENDGYYADLLHADAMREFLRNSFEPYAERFQQEFGNAVPGVFTDEPNTRGALPWSVPFPEEFRKRRGYDLIPRLPLLFFQTPESPRIRHDYWKTVYELFRDNYMTQLGEWCGEHGLMLTGHLLSEPDLRGQMLGSGGAMAHYVPMHAPGIDILGERITEVSTCKQASSICNQFDKPLMLSELYGCTGYHFSFEAQKWIGDWQMALGVNLLCPHLTLYTMKGCAKRDYPPSYFYQTPWWRHYKHIADYQARLCYILRQGRAVQDILLIHPLTGAWCAFHFQAGAERKHGLAEENQAYHDTMNHLLALHRDFDLGDETVMAEYAKVEGAQMCIGSGRYKTVMVAPTCNLESTTVKLLEDYVEAGGNLLWLTPTPTLVDGKPDDRVRHLASSAAARRAAPSLRNLRELLDASHERTVSVLRADTLREAGKVLCRQSTVDDKHVLFLANTDRDVPVPLKVRVPLKGAWERWDCETGDVTDVPSVECEHGSEVELALAPAGSALLCLNPDRPAIPMERPRAPRIRSRTLNPRGSWAFRRIAPNSLILDRCAYSIDNQPFSEEMFMIEAQEQWRRRFDLFSVRAMNADTQPWKRLQDPANLTPRAWLALRYGFTVKTLPETETCLVLEDPADFEITVNGTRVDAAPSGWFMDKAFEKVPIGNLLKRGRNTIELRINLTAMRVIEDIFLVGDFGVDHETFAIVREPKRLRTGDWCAQRYPFYTDGMIYETTFSVSDGFKGSVAVELERFEGTVAALWINGEKAAVLGWPPYRADVSRFVRPGANELGVEIVGSPRNLMGPRHSADRHPGGTGPTTMVDTTETDYHIVAAGLMGNVNVVYAR